MQYEVSKLAKNNISLNKNQIFPVMGLYCFVLGTSLLGFSVYLFLESSGFVEQVFINWSGQGLFWSFITLFIPRIDSPGNRKSAPLLGSSAPRE